VEKLKENNMGVFNQLEYDSLAPYEQKQYEIDNPRPRAKRGSSFEASFNRMMQNVSENVEGKERIEKNLENYRSKVGSDAGGRNIKGGGAGGSDELLRAINKPYKKGGKVKSASSRADGCCVKGKTKGRII
jgi:hypothetical protein